MITEDGKKWLKDLIESNEQLAILKANKTDTTRAEELEIIREYIRLLKSQYLPPMVYDGRIVNENNTEMFFHDDIALDKLYK